MVALETSGCTTARPEHHNTDKEEKNDLRNYFMKMTDALQEEMKNSLKNVGKEKQKVGRNQ